MGHPLFPIACSPGRRVWRRRSSWGAILSATIPAPWFWRQHLYGHNFAGLLKRPAPRPKAHRFCSPCARSAALWGGGFDQNQWALLIEKSPASPIPLRRPACIFMTHRCGDMAASIRPRPVYELEITDVNRRYIWNRGQLHRRDQGARLRLAGHRYASIAAGSRANISPPSRSAKALKVFAPKRWPIAPVWTGAEQL